MNRKLLVALAMLTLITNLFAIEHSGDITADETWYAADEHLLTGQTFVKSGATLTIEAGTTIKSNEDDGAGLAPALVVEKGAMIMAEGTADAPITFTTVLTADEIGPTEHIDRAGGDVGQVADRGGDQRKDAD